MNPKPNFIFFLSEGEIYAFHIIKKKYYSVTKEYFNKVHKLSQRDYNHISDEEIQELKEIGFDQSSSNILWEGDTPSHIAHQSSRINKTDFDKLSKEEFVKEYTQISQAIYSAPKPSYPEGKIIALPEPRLADLACLTLQDCFLKRKTCREFFPYEMSLQHLSTLLYACFGPIHGLGRNDLDNIGIVSSGMRRSSPSSTGLCGCSAIVWVNSVSEILSGLYIYHEEKNYLIKLSQALNSQELSYAAIDQPWSDNLSAGIFIINNLQMAWIKDKTCRGYLASHQEAGHISQNILLAATALGLHTWMSGSFRDDFLNEVLFLQDHQFVSLFIGLGKGSNEPVSKEYLNLLTI
jgi:SagB-type dehydrogenase family enzyme